MSTFDIRVLSGISVFSAIVESGTFAAAGERMGMSQPGVSRTISRLESRLKLRLFDRTTRVVSLTEDGRNFYEQVMPHLIGLEKATTIAQSRTTSVQGRLRVNIDAILSRQIPGPRLEHFLSVHPDLRVELITRDKLGDIISDGFDLAVRFGKPRNSTLVARKILDTQVLTVASTSYIQRRGRPARPEAIASDGHTCIEFRDPDTGKPFPWEFLCEKKKICVDVKSQLTVNDSGTLLKACLAGYGIAQILKFGHEDLIDGNSLVNLFPDWPDERFPLYALHPSKRHPPAKTIAFLDFLKSLDVAETS
ncbi:DNA-binding transcriptional LysR family regulator [Pseudomonas sp. BIGb0450]|jgi:DNA-binding transcriptional LysR family regulator|uniref:LysR family transcriptional regulator n=1 Tax=unclassified Pseudomonas TaxID=196821 RepID=UPI00216756EE|nr:MULTISPECIES: LysR family transcriptional regulator [unclassified Pseudomonas]MCS3419370.1 DNA-binding transcriptional LysR family regulator [Pseudomonas sp. BIGb0558]MCS3438258.1 DNA-binding transcriptional LysR family regulator [Pseudomonas sp. BIGb0450]